MSDPSPSIERPPEPQAPRGSCLGVLMIASLISGVAAALNFVSMGVFGLVAIVVGVILLVSMFHYLVWGWWLGGMIRREVEAEEPPVDDEE